MKTIQKEFIDFLKREGVFEAYVKNWDNNFSAKHIRCREMYVSRAFPWLLSPQGSAFWANIGGKWCNYLRAMKKKKDPAEYHTRCQDCGRFIKKEFWVVKYHIWKHYPLCLDCLSCYDEVS